jgi:hypothetical protein
LHAFMPWYLHDVCVFHVIVFQLLYQIIYVHYGLLGVCWCLNLLFVSWFS